MLDLRRRARRIDLSYAFACVQGVGRFLKQRVGTPGESPILSDKRRSCTRNRYTGHLHAYSPADWTHSFKKIPGQ